MKICDAKDCKKKGTVKFGRFMLCVDCYTSVAYDCQPLPMKSDAVDKEE